MLSSYFAGNPGNEQFYAHFGQVVLSKISRIMQISEENSLFCTISHLNHVPIPQEYSKMNISNFAGTLFYYFYDKLTVI